MRLDICLLADQATATPDGKLFIHGGGISRLTPPTLPWVHPMLALVLRFETEEEDFGRAFELALTLLSPGGEPALPEGGPRLEIKPARAAVIEGEQSYAQAAIQLAGLPFERPGIYALRVSLNGEEIAAPTLAVIDPEAGVRTNRAERRARQRRA